MRIGYPCINRTIGCTANSTFRLASYSAARMKAAVANNLACLEKILRYNQAQGILFFRISSDLIPFAAHPVCRYPWQKRFKAEFLRIGRFIKSSGMRISMHPDQFVLINALKPDIVRRSVAELVYHAEVLDAMGLDRTAKIQIHIGGLYGDRASALDRFAREYKKLPPAVRRRLVIENDDRLFPLADCLELHSRTGIPVLFDVFHHSLLNRGEKVSVALRLSAATWKRTDGPLMCDYSGQQPGCRVGAHAESADMADFGKFAKLCRPFNPDIMLEIKDKEKSALRLVKALS